MSPAFQKLSLATLSALALIGPIRAEDQQFDPTPYIQTTQSPVRVADASAANTPARSSMPRDLGELLVNRTRSEVAADTATEDVITEVADQPQAVQDTQEAEDAGPAIEARSEPVVDQAVTPVALEQATQLVIESDAATTPGASSEIRLVLKQGPNGITVEVLTDQAIAAPAPKAEPVEPVSYHESSPLIFSDDACGCQPVCKPKTCDDCCQIPEEFFPTFPADKKPNCDYWFREPCDLNVGGWLAGGYTWNPDGPVNRSNAPVLFNERSNDFLLNQAYVFVESPTCMGEWDIGGRVDFFWGSDARFVTVPGLEETRTDDNRWNGEDSTYGISLPQAYVEMTSPLPTKIKVGHFYSLVGWERVQSPENFFYSHSLSWTYAAPFTYSGVMTDSALTEYLNLDLGVVNGWDALERNHNAPVVAYGLRWQSPCSGTKVSFHSTIGQDTTEIILPGETEAQQAFRYYHNFLVSQQITEGLTYIFEHNYVYQEDGIGVINLPPPGFSVNTTPSQFYGISQALLADLAPGWQSGLRFEWFRDEDGSRITAPVRFNPGGPAFTGGNFYNLTGSLRHQPLENVMLRLEARYDWSDVRGNPDVPGGNGDLRIFDDLTSGRQWLFSADAIVRF